jgi:hypothetical protein
MSPASANSGCAAWKQGGSSGVAGVTKRETEGLHLLLDVLSAKEVRRIGVR